MSKITPITILCSDARNVQRPYLFNEIMNISKKFQTTITFRTGEGKISIPEAPKELEQVLISSGITCRNGKNLEIIA